jgi:hypothetical protein
MAEMRIMLAGSWDERDARPLEETFATWVGAGRLLYLPSGLVHPSSKEAGFRRLQRTIASLGVQDADAWMDLNRAAPRDLFAYDAVYLEGGNTFYLLHQLRAHGLDQALDEFARAGRPLYGSGAGAIVLGYDISSAEHVDDNALGLADRSGLDLALGHTVWCEYGPGTDRLIRAYVARTGIPSIGLSETCGFYRQGDRLLAAGSTPLAYFTLAGQTEIAPGQPVA